MKTLAYYCDSESHKGATAAQLLITAKVMVNGTVIYRVRDAHVCNDPRHIGELLMDRLYDVEAAVEEVRKEHPELNTADNVAHMGEVSVSVIEFV